MRFDCHKNICWISLVLVLCGGRILAQDGSKAAAHNVSLTLIPPSPVTDQVTLDIRAAIYNSGNHPEEFLATFYLDDETEGKLLHQERVRVDPGSPKGLRFRWSTKNQAGNHKILLVCRSPHMTFCTKRVLQVLASDVRSTRTIDGSFMGFYHWSEDEGKYWNADIRTMSDNQWKELVNAQHELSMSVIIIQEVFRNQMYVDQHSIERDGYKGLAYYPSSLFPGRMPITASDPVEAVLEQADTNGMQVFIGVGMYAWFDFSKGSLQWHKKVARELWDRYGHHPSFYGWYVSEEMDGGLGTGQQRQNIVAFFHEFSSFVHGLAPDKPVMLATNSQHLRGAEEAYHRLLPDLDILCTFGFHRMPAGDLTGEEAAALLQKLCDTASTHLWLDMEVFDFGVGNALIPRSINGVLSDMRRFPGFEKIVCYQFPGLLSSPAMSIHPGGEQTVKLFLAYKDYLSGLLQTKK